MKSSHRPLISSGRNPRIQAALALEDRRERDRLGLFKLEGAREISRALAAGCEIKDLFICSELASPLAVDLAAAAPSSIDIQEVTAAVFAKLAVRSASDGVVAVLAQKRWQLSDLCAPSTAPPLLLATQGIEKPGNLGALLRVADGVGASGVAVLDQALDLYNPNVLRASLGTAFSRPVVAASSEAFADFASIHGLQVYAAALTATARAYDAVDWHGPAVILLGEEAKGLSPFWLERAQCIKIPMLGLADSLNVATAGAVLAYEALRQRRGPSR